MNLLMKNKGTKTFYENWADQEISKNYDLRKMTLLWKSKIFSKLVPRCHQFRNLLDVGCAEGILTTELRKLLNIELAVGIDISINFIYLGKDRDKTIHFLQNDGLLPFKDKSFDITICSDFIEHVADILKYLQEIRRVSKFTLFKIPIESNLVGDLFRAIGLYPKHGKDHPSGHLHMFSKESALEVIKLNGFSIITYSFEITPLMILYHSVSKIRVFLNPLTYLGIFSRIIFPKWHIPLMGGNLFAFCKA